jgi:adenine-specific DNA-methyltransferase
MRRILAVAPGEVVLDFFAGSGTLGQAVLEAAREDGEPPRRFVLADAGPHFETVLRPRIVKTLHAGEWRDGAPVTREGVSGIVQCLRLESFDDALESVRLSRTDAQQDLLAANSDLGDRYTLRYMLDTESGGARVPPASFAKPAAAHIEVTVDGAVTTMPVDLPATFTWLMGLRVRRVWRRDGVHAITGVGAEGKTILVLWRDAESIASDGLEEWFSGVDAGLRAELDVVYVNGDCTLERVRDENEHWVVRLIEDDFERLMFERAEAERAVG